ncbi:MAG TPA: adenylate/guanylate cyclase domain-containing protein [Stellaceae bacterium]|nr:adenylate/guanylate cyclase domain-containing protein [Stellaceae bacterium]
MADDTKGFPPVGVLTPAGTKPWPSEPQYPLGAGKTTIGRAPHCDVQINHPTVSRTHAELSWAGGHLMLTHLSSVNLTLVNGIPVREQVALRTGDLIELADGILLRLEVYTSGEEDTLAISRDDRRMYAVLYADVAGYSRLIEDNDIATARQIETCLGVFRDETQRRNGRIVNIAGDGILLLFPSAEAALSCAIVCQGTFAQLNLRLEPARRMEFRIGINSGDILITPAGMHGDAINIAARVQALAVPGGILVTGVVHDQLQGHEGFKFEYVKTNELKNISREVRTYRVAM